MLAALMPFSLSIQYKTNRMLLRVIYAFILVGLLASCEYGCEDPYNFQPQKVMGWKPVKISIDSAQKISYTGTPQETVKAGKIVVYGNWILQNELGKGIHIINKSVPENTQKTGFIKILGNSDFSIRGDMLYANSFYDILVINIADLSQPQVVQKIPGAFYADNTYSMFAPDLSGYYDCNFQTTDSVPVSWYQDSVWNQCYNP